MDDCLIIQRRLRCLDRVDPLSRLRALEEEHQTLIEDNMLTYSTMQWGNLDSLEESQEYKYWRDSARGGVLLIWAMNHHDSGPTDSLWLSSAIADFATSMEQKHYQVIFHAIPSGTGSPHTILALIICKLSEWDLAFWEQQRHLVDSESIRNESSFPEYLVRTIKECFNQWTKRHSTEPIYLMLDISEGWVHNEDDLRSGGWRLVVDTLLDCIRISSALKLCVLGERDSWSKRVSDIILMSCLQRQLGQVFWDTGCLRQGNVFNNEV